MAALFGSVLAVFFVRGVSDTYGKRAAVGVMALLGLVSIWQGTQLIYSTLYRGDYFVLYDIAGLDNNAVQTLKGSISSIAK